LPPRCRRIAERGAVAALLALAACVGPDEPLSDAQEVVAALTSRGSNLGVTLSPERPSGYRVGDRIALSVRHAANAYIAVLRVERGGKTTIVFPNRAQPNAQVAPDGPLRIEGPVEENKGDVLFEVIAATGGESFLFKRKPAEGAAYAELGGTTRALAKEISTSLKKSADVTATHIVVHVAGE
jgi:hypothetical protein